MWTTPNMSKQQVLFLGVDYYFSAFILYKQP